MVLANNILPNSAFEDGVIGSLPRQWSSSGSTISPYLTEDYIRGGKCLYLPKGGVSRVSTFVKLREKEPPGSPIRPADKPRITLYGSIFAIASPGCKLSYGVKWTEVDGPYEETFKVFNKEEYFIRNWSSNTQGWVKLTGKAIPVPQVVTRCQVIIENSEGNTGPVIVDDVYLGTTLRPPQPSIVPSPISVKSLFPLIIAIVSVPGLAFMRSKLEG